MLKRPNNFDDPFKQATFKTFIENCGILITDGNQNVLINEDEIEKIETRLSNSFLSTFYPKEETIIQIIGWDRIDQARKTKLTTLNRFLYIRYKVENITTTGCRVCLISDWQINYRQNRATIKCVGLLNREYNTGFSHNPFYWGDNGTYPIINIMKDACETVFFFIYSNNVDGKVINYHASPLLWTSMTSKYPFRFANKTIAEALQHLIVAFYGGARVNFDFATNQYDMSILPIGLSSNDITEHYIDNAYDDFEITQKRNVKNAVFYGYTKTATEELYHHGFFNRDTFTISSDPLPMKDGWVIDRVFIVVGGTYIDANTWVMGADFVITAEFTMSGYNGGDFYIRGYKITDPMPQQQNDAITLSSCLVEQPPASSTLADNIVGKAKLYLKYDKDFSFRGRINPALEPLDYIWLGGEIGNAFIENVALVYNGGFSGEISGKIIGLFDPEVSNFSFTYIDSDIGHRAKFDIKNNNGKDLALKFYADNTQFDPFNPTIVPANSTLTYYEDENGTASDFYYYAKDKNDGTLTQNIYVVFEYGDGRESEKVEVIHRDMVEYDPEITDKRWSMPDWYFIVENPNNEELTLNISCSSGDQTFTIGANDSITITQQNCPMLDDSISAWLNSDLHDNIIGWFTASDNAISNNVIILEANG